MCVCVWLQKMEALKKAYAEIILNTAKEAAARVMQSERKALHFQHDLRATKDEALRMLTRFKQLIDSKVLFFFLKKENFVFDFHVQLGFVLVSMIMIFLNVTLILTLH